MKGNSPMPTAQDDLLSQFAFLLDGWVAEGGLSAAAKADLSAAIESASLESFGVEPMAANAEPSSVVSRATLLATFRQLVVAGNIVSNHITTSDLLRLIDDEPISKDQPTDGKPALLVRLLDPSGLRRMMCVGAGLLVLGIVGWLWSVGVFEDPLLAACCLGVGNLVMLASGVGLQVKTRSKTAGLAVSLLACLLLPLNLWFYDAQGLVTLADGGHLWLAGLGCCAIYAGVIGLLKDHRFVYPLIGGVALTGLLLLADHSVGRFWEVLAPSALLAVLGTICIQLRWMFLVDHPVFSRRTFGRAVFGSGHVLLAAGLLGLALGRIYGHFYQLIPATMAFGMPDVVLFKSSQTMALLLIGLGLFSYVSSYLMASTERGAGGLRYLIGAFLSFMWGLVIVLDLMDVAIGPKTFSIVLSATAVAANIACLRPWARKERASDSTNRDSAWASNLGEWGSIAALVAGFFALAAFVVECPLLFVSLLFREANDFSRAIMCGLVALGSSTSILAIELRAGSKKAVWHSVLAGVGFVGCGMAIADSLHLPILFHFALAVVMLGVVVLLSRRITEPKLGYLVQIGLDSGSTLLHWLLGVAFVLEEPLLRTVNHGLRSEWTWLLLSAAMCGMQCRLAWGTHRRWSTGLAMFSGWIAISNLLDCVSGGVPDMVASGSLVGLAALVGCRLFPHSGQETVDADDSRVTWGLWTAALASAAGLLLNLSVFVVADVTASLIVRAVIQAAAGIGIACLTSRSAVRPAFFALGLAHLLLAMINIVLLSDLNTIQQVELFCTLLGTVLVVWGYGGWFTEKEERNQSVDLSLVIGSLLLTIPLAVGLAHQRLWPGTEHSGWVLFHDLGGIAAAIVLLGTGIMCQLRTTTLAGAGLLAVNAATLLALIPFPQQLQTVSVYLMVGGGAFFGVAVLLSVYREQLLALPERVANGEGIFEVLTWR